LGTPVTADNCSVVSVVSDKAIDFTYPVGTTEVVWTVTDAAGNTASATQIVTVRDVEKPNAKASDITIKLNSLGVATIAVADVNNGSSDNCGILSTAISKSSFDCSNVGKNTVVLTVTDNSNNVSTANAIVTVVDDIIPVINPVSPIDVNTSAGICGANITVTAPNASDNCTVGTPIGTRSDAKALNAVYPLGRTIITWNVKDVNGNAAIPVVQTVDVTDNQVPVITTNGDRNVNVDVASCGAIVNVTATATDNCSVGMPMGVRSDAKPLAAEFPVGTTTITWNVTDVNGNAAVAVVQTVVVTDNIKPVIVANGDKFVTSDPGQCGALVAVSATATDNCSVGSPVGVRYFNGSTTPDGLPVTAPYAVGTTLIRWNVTDVNRNTAVEVVQRVVVKDIQIPVINGTVVTINANTDANACGATVIVTPPTASDNCTVGSPVGTRSDNLALTALYPIGTTTITWNVTDVNGNVALSTSTSVKVKDMTPPTVVTRDITVPLNVGGFVTIVPEQINNGSTDACGIASYSLDKTSFNCSDTGAAQTVTLTVIDIYGNVNTKTALVTVTETVKPIARVLTSVTLQLNSSGTVSVVPADLNNGSTDNCRVQRYDLSKSTFDCSNIGQNIVSFTVTDSSGNVSDPVQTTIIVQDKVVPVVITQPFTAILNAQGTVSITAANVNNSSSDNCTSASELIYSISKSTFTCDNVGENIITLTVTDKSGNVNQAFATVNVVDNIPPTVTTRNISLVLDGDSVSITPEDVLVSATDACGVDVLSYRLSKDTFTIVDVLASPVTITVYVTDINGNVGSATALVTFPVDPTDVVEAITPNGDGINDTWVIDNITNHPNSIVRVFNRWGSIVYSAKNYQNDWDGKVNGSDATLPDGHTYFYQVDIDGDGKIDSQGWLYITRQ
jgi:gliding motility-associated-like protein